MNELSHKFPKGFKQFSILAKMESNDGLTYSEIIKLAYEMSHGVNTFDIKWNRGYWSGAFEKEGSGQFGRPHYDGWVTRLCSKGWDGKYRMNSQGTETYVILTNKFAGVSFASAVKQHQKQVDEKPSRVEKFKEKYSNLLGNFETKNEAKKIERITCTNGLVIPVTEVTLGGFKLDDKVLYYRKRNGTTGVGYIQSILIRSNQISNRDELYIGTESGGTIPQISYFRKTNSFKEIDGSEIQIEFRIS